MSADSNSKWVSNATDDTFEKEVIERSAATLCLVDFWAEWCGPCRTLAPILEELAEEMAGQFHLVKVDTEVAPKTAASFGIQSIPSVYAFLKGEVVNGFQGVMPKDQVQSWIEQLLVQNQAEQANALLESDPVAAEKKFSEILVAMPDNVEVQIKRAEALMKLDRTAEAGEVIERLEERGFLEPEAQKLKSQLELLSKGDLDLESVQAIAKAEPENLNAQFQLAEALVGQEQFEQAFEICLDLVSRDRDGMGEKARELMVGVFQALPDDSELTSEYRRKLSLALY